MKVVLITGGSKGIGKAIAEIFALHKYSVIVGYSSDKKSAEETVTELNKISSAYKVKVDVSSEKSIKKMVKIILSYFGQIGVLINNAGIHIDSMSWKMDKKVWDRVLAVNLTGPFLCIKHILPIMRKQNYGRIINISSVVGQIGGIGVCNYSASKAGLFGLTKSIAKEVANKGISVNCVTLGYINTGMGARLPQKVKDYIIAQTPIGRFGERNEVASLVFFLCKSSDFITGQVIHINGGLYV